MEVVGGSRGTEVGRDGGEWREEEEADGVPQEVPLVVPHCRGEEPAGERPRVARNPVLLLTQLAGVFVDGGEPLLYTGAMDQAYGAGAMTRGDQSLSLSLATVTDAAEEAGVGQLRTVWEKDRPRGSQAFRPS